MEKGLNVEITADYSLKNILKLTKEKRAEVVRTPHVGIFDVNNLICAAAGVPLVLMDRTLPSKDPIYRPGLAPTGDGNWRPIGKPDVIVAKQPEIIETHVPTLKSLFPETNIMTMNEELRYWQQETKGAFDEYINVVGPLTVEMGLWKRWIDNEGNVYQVSDQTSASLITWERIVADGIYGVTENGKDSGWLLPNELYIVLSAIMFARRSGVDNTFVLAGRDMHLYAPQIEKEMGRIYAVWKEKFGKELPEAMRLIIMTTINNRWASLASKKPVLDKLQEILEAEGKISIERGKAFKEIDADTRLSKEQKQEQKNKAIQHYATLVDQARDGVYETIRSLPDIVAATENATRQPFELNQHLIHEARAHGDDFYIHENALQLTPRQMHELSVSLDRATQLLFNTQKLGKYVPVSLPKTYLEASKKHTPLV